MLIHASRIRKFMQIFPALNSYNFTKDGEFSCIILLSIPPPAPEEGQRSGPRSGNFKGSKGCSQSDPS